MSSEKVNTSENFTHAAVVAVLFSFRAVQVVVGVVLCFTLAWCLWWLSTIYHYFSGYLPQERVRRSPICRCYRR